MAFTADDLTRIESAIKTGQRRVRFADREVEYRTFEEMLKIRDLIRAEVADADGTDKSRYIRYLEFHNDRC